MSYDVTTYGDFTNLLTDVGLIDKSYPVKGCYVWRPYGMAIKRRVYDLIHAKFEAAGYEEHSFPRLVHGESARAVANDIKDFRPGLFWLRGFDGERMDLFLNPTGECGVYTMFRNWITQEADLPFRAYQHDSIYRPHDDPRMFLNGDEQQDLVEAHGAFASAEAAEEEHEAINEQFLELYDELGIPTLALKRPRAGNNPVYEELYSYESVLPSMGKSFNYGGNYLQQQIYSRALEVTYSDQEGTEKYTNQLTFGISERVLAVMLDLHRDEHGIRLLPSVAPTQVEIIPVYGGGDNEDIDEYATTLQAQLPETVRTDVVDGSANAGKRLAKGRARGIPIRIGVSEQNRVSNTARVYLRTQATPLTDVPIDKLTANITTYLQTVRDEIVAAADRQLDSKITEVETVDQLIEASAATDIVRHHWCGDASCREQLDAQARGEILGTRPDGVRGLCLVCDQPASDETYFGLRVSG
jgi:prolyl-tRNA synthetase